MRSTIYGIATTLLGSAAVYAETAAKYTDLNTGIEFLGYQSQGYVFGMALPSKPSTDAIIQLTSTNLTKGGWIGVDFGSDMVGPLLLVAWSIDDKVMISPRVAKGYEVKTGADPYTSSHITLTPIPSGTISNSTYFAATFVCGGCLNGDSFNSTTTKAIFGYAYSQDAVADPSDKSTQLTDHTKCPYGSFDVTIADAESSDYAKWAAMTSGGAGGGSASSSSATTAPSPSVASSASSEAAPSAATSSAASSSSSAALNSQTTAAASSVGISSPTTSSFGMKPSSPAPCSCSCVCVL